MDCEGFRCLEMGWNTSRTPTVITEKKDRLLAALPGRLFNAVKWPDIIRRVQLAMERANAALRLPAGNRRGRYRSVAVGVSFGNGSKHPGMLSQEEWNRLVLEELMTDPDVQLVASFASSCFALYAPKLFTEYRATLGQLYAEYTMLRQIFPNSVFPAVSFNFGPEACTVLHVDNSNRAIGWCSILALGDFDPTQGGHIVLEELRLVIEFPPGSTILIPSALCRHGNMPIQKGETRMVMTQYAAGGLFRYVDYGYHTKKELRELDPERFEGIEAKQESRWVEQMSLFSTVDHLHADRIACDLIK
ncbi:hypothetical protein NM688_g4351 [Phlebia brevispora]|uniref:Uncharacterized protein n=1 Tax=Phlebia brevispora TaxID=194682 RepID=A0ACC1T3C7_9APHY|nr:hypothetical protein NM688_g4351 [Phlebia brevispora]